VRMPVPVVAQWLAGHGIPRAELQLIDHHGREALRQEQQRKTRADRVAPRASAHRVAPRPGWRLSAYEEVRSFTIPVMIAEEPHARQTPGTLQSIKVIQVPHVLPPGITPHAEPAGHPAN